MDYNSIGSFLEKFKKLIYQKEEYKNIVIETISKEISHKVDTSAVKIKNGIIFVTGSPILRSEIMIHKKQILNELKNLLTENNFIDIK